MFLSLGNIIFSNEVIHVLTVERNSIALSIKKREIQKDLNLMALLHKQSSVPFMNTILSYIQSKCFHIFHKMFSHFSQNVFTFFTKCFYAIRDIFTISYISLC